MSIEIFDERDLVYHVARTKSFVAINRVIRTTTTLQLGSPFDCQPYCHRNGSSKRFVSLAIMEH